MLVTTIEDIQAQEELAPHERKTLVLFSNPKSEELAYKLLQFMGLSVGCADYSIEPAARKEVIDRFNNADDPYHILGKHRQSDLPESMLESALIANYFELEDTELMRLSPALRLHLFETLTQLLG